HLRRRHPALRRRGFFRGAYHDGTGRSDITWHGLRPNRPDFSPASRALALALDGRLTGREPDCDFYLASNANTEPAAFTVPPSPTGRPLRREGCTALASPVAF